MRRLLTFCALVALAAPLAARAADTTSAADGTLSVKNATGTIVLRTNGVIIGHAEKIARLTVNDLDLSDGKTIVLGAESTDKLSKNKTTYKGEDVRFKLLGGDNVVYIRGSGISLSVVGEGRVWMDGGSVANDGKYSIDDGPFRSLPDVITSFTFGG